MRKKAWKSRQCLGSSCTRSSPSFANPRKLSGGHTGRCHFSFDQTGIEDAKGTHGLKDDNLLYRAVRQVKRALPQLVVITDVALDPYTTHGHDGRSPPTEAWIMMRPSRSCAGLP